VDTPGVKANGVEKPYDVIISITNDYYKAYLSIEMHLPEVNVAQQDILDALKAKNISYGIDMDMVESVIQNPRLASNVLIATGIPHANGIDGEITFNINREKNITPRMLPNGRVDFKDIHFVDVVYEGDLLATRTLPTVGTDGMTVTGREIKAKPGKPVVFKAGKNIRVSDDEMMLVAARSGNVQFDGDRISIIEILELRKDVGPETGNIDFIGKVIVYGNVLSGYEIHSDNDVEINGIVEAAHITTKANLTINGGVQGNDQATLEVGGNLTVNFLNNCRATVKGNIKSDSLMHCHITCDGSVLADGKRGMVVGGELNVRVEIKAKTVGSEMGTLTRIRMGIDSTVMDQFKELAEQIKESQENISKLTQAQRMIRKQLDASGNHPELQTMFEKTAATLTQSNDTLRQQQMQLKELNDLIDRLRDARVLAQMVYPGVKIRIGNSYYNVKDPLQGVRIQKDEGDIRLLSY